MFQLNESAMSSSNSDKQSFKKFEITIDANEALNEYFKMKLNYETQNAINKKQIVTNTRLSTQEKRNKYKKLKPKCIHCKRPGGTRFNIHFFPSTDTGESYREYSASCGIISNPCNLNIKIKLGKVQLLPEILNSVEIEIKSNKNIIIDDKNKLLFGYLTAEEALEEFDEIKDIITSYSSIYEDYLTDYNKLVDNKDKNQELSEATLNSYVQIEQIKHCIKQMNETNNVQFARDAVNIYINTLSPLLKTIADLKYNENMVLREDNSSVCKLMQNKYSIQNLSYFSSKNIVVAYDVDFWSSVKV